MAKETNFYVNINSILRAGSECLKIGEGHTNVRMLPGIAIIFVTKVGGM